MNSPHTSKWHEPAVTLYGWVLMLIMIMRMDKKKTYLGFWPNSCRRFTLSWKPTIQNFVTTIQRGVKLWWVILEKTWFFVILVSYKCCRAWVTQPKKCNLNFCVNSVPLASQSDTTYNHLPGGWKIVVRKNRHILFLKKG